MSGKQNQPGFALAHSSSHLLHRAQQIAADQFAARATSGGLTVRQFAVLTAVSEQPGLTQSDLVRATGIDRSTLADLIARLQERGLVDRDRLEEDARAKSVRLTEMGRLALQQALPQAQAADDAILALLPKGKRQAFLALLQRLSGLEEGRGPREKDKLRKLEKKKKAEGDSKAKKAKRKKKAKRAAAAETTAPAMRREASAPKRA